jgi:hypothetical protein
MGNICWLAEWRIHEDNVVTSPAEVDECETARGVVGKLIQRIHTLNSVRE